MSQNCFFRIHYKELCGDSEKNTNFVFGHLVRILRGWFFEIFRRSFTSGKIISKLDTKYKCEMSQFWERCFVHAKHLTLKFIRILGQIFFLEVIFQNYRFKYSMKKWFIIKINLINQKLSTLSLDYYINLKIIIKSVLIYFYLKK